MIFRPLLKKIKIEPMSDRKYKVNLDYSMLRDSVLKALGLPKPSKLELSPICIDRIVKESIDYIITTKFVIDNEDNIDNEPYGVYIPDTTGDYLITISSVKELRNDIIFGGNIIE